MLPGIFLDRDGVIIEHRPGYVLSWSEVVFFPQALVALARIHDRSARIVIITNQSAIGRGLLDSTVAAEINHRIEREINKAGGRIDGVFVCPHHPRDNCPCRKPRPGLILQAAQNLEIDLARSVLIGDNLSDLQAGRAAGIPRLALVRTGLGNQQLLQPIPDELNDISIFADLAEVLQCLFP
jgi:D-glycero-D-manno-heptose 1,7-bisphosphate phosphatase